VSERRILRITNSQAKSDLSIRLRLVNGILGLTESEMNFLCDALEEMKRFGEEKFGTPDVRKAIMLRYAGGPGSSDPASQRNYIKKLKQKGIISPSGERGIYNLSQVVSILSKEELGEIQISFGEQEQKDKES
jgi:hypothetical protein